MSDEVAVDVLARMYEKLGILTDTNPPVGPMIELAQFMWELVHQYDIDPSDLGADDTLLSYGLAVLRPDLVNPDEEAELYYVQHPRISDVAPDSGDAGDLTSEGEDSGDWRTDEEGDISESGVLDEVLDFGQALYGSDFEVGFKRTSGLYQVHGKMGPTTVFHTEGHEDPMSAVCELADCLEEEILAKKGGSA